MTGSLAYRNNEAAIIRGDVPEKYLRILPFVTGQRILEIGSAEGVLALLLAREGREVTAVEKSYERHEAAHELFLHWKERYRIRTAPKFICGDITDMLGLMEGAETLVAVRSIYYLACQLNTVFAASAKAGIKNVVLCGNKNRAERWRNGNPDPPLGDMNRYAAREGMEALLGRHGYDVVQTVREGDEIVVGRRG